MSCSPSILFFVLCISFLSIINQMEIFRYNQGVWQIIHENQGSENKRPSVSAAFLVFVGLFLFCLSDGNNMIFRYNFTSIYFL